MNLDYYTATELVVLRTAEIEVFYEVKSGGSGKKIMAVALDDSEIKISAEVFLWLFFMSSVCSHREHYSPN